MSFPKDTDFSGGLYIPKSLVICFSLARKTSIPTSKGLLGLSPNTYNVPLIPLESLHMSTRCSIKYGSTPFLSPYITK